MVDPKPNEDRLSVIQGRHTKTALLTSYELDALSFPPGNGTHRIVATVAQALENPSIIDIHGLLDNRGPVRDCAIVNELI